MATRQSTVEFILDQITGAGAISAKKMFGEYGIFFDGVMVALVCDDQLYVKPTSGGRVLAGAVEEAPPYPGAKPCLMIASDRWEDGEWLGHLMQVTVAELPAPKTKRSR